MIELLIKALATKRLVEFMLGLEAEWREEYWDLADYDGQNRAHQIYFVIRYPDTIRCGWYS